MIVFELLRFEYFNFLTHILVTAIGFSLVDKGSGFPTVLIPSWSILLFLLFLFNIFILHNLRVFLIQTLPPPPPDFLIILNIVQYLYAH